MRLVIEMLRLDTHHTRNRMTVVLLMFFVLSMFKTLWCTLDCVFVSSAYKTQNLINRMK